MFTGVLAIIALAFVFWLVEVIRAKIAGRPTSWQQYEQARALSGDETAPPASPVDAALGQLAAPSPQRSAWARRLMLVTMTAGLGLGITVAIAVALATQRMLLAVICGMGAYLVGSLLAGLACARRWPAPRDGVAQ